MNAHSKHKNKQLNLGLNKLTSWEWEALGNGYNIADGHAHQGQSREYLEIVNNLPKLYFGAEKKSQKEIQNRFEEIFFELAGQKSYKKLQPPLYQYACSLSIEAVANYLRLKNKSVALLHPTFDNLADILKRHKIPMVALEEKAITQPGKELEGLQTDALFLVCPNNPTGLELTKHQYIAIINYCQKYNKLLILDYSFRFYSSHTTWDQYELLIESGIDFIVLEDTGKTWPTLELKVGITLANDSVYQYLLDITNDFLLNVSPFTLTLLTEYMNVERKNKSHLGSQKIVAANRVSLRKILEELPLEEVNPNSKLSVAWIKLPNMWNSMSFCKWLGNHGVHVLPGGPFYWNNPRLGDSYIRIALARPRDYFKNAINHFRKTTVAYHGHKG